MVYFAFGTRSEYFKAATTILGTFENEQAAWASVLFDISAYEFCNWDSCKLNVEGITREEAPWLELFDAWEESNSAQDSLALYRGIMEWATDDSASPDQVKHVVTAIATAMNEEDSSYGICTKYTVEDVTCDPLTSADILAEFNEAHPPPKPGKRKRKRSKL